MFKTRKNLWKYSKEGRLNRRRGLTLVEVLTVVIILATLAGITFAGFSKAKKKAEANQAAAYLRTVRAAQKIRFAKDGEYSCQTVNSCDTGAEIKTALGVEVTTGSYQFDVVAGPTTFIAKARENPNKPTGGASCGSDTQFCLDQDGVWTGNHEYRPAGTES